MKEGDVPVEGATTPSAQTPPEAAKALRPLKALQWAVPALTGAIIVASATMGEQQRPAEVAKGVAQRAVDATRLAVLHPQAAGKTVAATLQH